MRSIRSLLNAWRKPRARRSTPREYYGEVLEIRILPTTGVMLRDYGNGSPTTQDYYVVSMSSSTTSTVTNYGAGMNVGSDFGQTGVFTSSGRNDVLSESGTNITVAVNSGSHTLGTPATWGTVDTMTGSSGTGYSGYIDGDGSHYLIGDFNGDGLDDLAHAIYNMSSGTTVIRVATNTGSSSFSSWSTAVTFSGVIANFRVGKLDSGSKVDLLATTTQIVGGTSVSNWTAFTDLTSGSFTTTVGPSTTISGWSGYQEIRLGNFDGDASNGLEMVAGYLTGRGSGGGSGLAPNVRNWFTWKPGASSLREVYSGTAWTESIPISGGYGYDERAFQNIRVGDFRDDSSYTADDLFGRDRTGSMHVLFSTGGTSWTFNDQVVGTFTVDTSSSYGVNGYYDNGFHIDSVGIYTGDFLGVGTDQIMWISRSMNTVYLTTFSGTLPGTITASTSSVGSLASYGPHGLVIPLNLDGGNWYGGNEGFGNF